MRNGTDDDHDHNHFVDNDDSSGGNDIYKHDYYCTLDDHDGPCVNHLVTSREQHDDVVPTVDLNDTINHYRDVIGDDDHPVDPTDYIAAVRAAHDAAARVLGGSDNAADRPADNDTAMRAYILERARYDASIADHADIFGPLRDAARSFLTATGDPVTP